MKCAHCCQEIQNDSKFCQYCGAMVVKSSIGERAFYKKSIGSDIDSAHKLDLKNTNIHFTEIANNDDKNPELEDPMRNLKTLNNHHYVDLGLPSGTLWATCNLGANLPHESGDYFAWGETSPKKEYCETNYQHRKLKETKFLFLSQTDYVYKKISELNGAGLDAAFSIWGGVWKLPSIDMFKELVDKCLWFYESTRDSYGYFVFGPTGNYIFLPFAGYRGYEVMRETEGFYWASNSPFDKSACCLEIDSKYRATHFFKDKFYGLPIRPVIDVKDIGKHEDTNGFKEFCWHPFNGIDDTNKKSSTPSSDTGKILYQRAIQGDELSQFKIARLYEGGLLGYSKSLSDALNWYMQSANKGVAQSKYRLGYMYLLGKGVPRNISKAKFWFTKAAYGGDKDAKIVLRKFGWSNDPKIVY